MSKKKTSTKRVQPLRTSRRPTVRRRPQKSSARGMEVHRRVVLYPQPPHDSWLDKLAWFANIALRAISIVSGITADLMAETVQIAAGSVLLLGAGDFATVSPFAVPIQSGAVTDPEVICLKSFPFERAGLRSLSIRIVPSVDAGSRGGMYAAVVLPVDSIDAESILNESPNELLSKYSYDYDTIIRHPKSVMSPTTSPVKLTIPIRHGPHNIRSMWNDATGFANAYPTVALCVAFSDLAASLPEDVSGRYAPAKALFEAHLKANMVLHDPGELRLGHNKTTAEQSCYTPKILHTGTVNINPKPKKTISLIKFFDHSFEAETVDGKVDLRKIDHHHARRILAHYNREDLLQQLDLPTDLSDMALE